MSVAERIKQVRTHLGLTQTEMAAKMSVTLRPYQLYEAGERPPKAESLEALIRLGINVNWLLSGEGEMLLGTTILDPACGSGGFLVHALAALDAELNGRINEAVTTVYAECGAKISPRDMGRVTAEIYNEIAAAGLESWEEKMGALRLAAGQLRRRLLSDPSQNHASDEGKRLA